MFFWHCNHVFFQGVPCSKFLRCRSVLEHDNVCISPFEIIWKSWVSHARWRQLLSSLGLRSTHKICTQKLSFFTFEPYDQLGLNCRGWRHMWRDARQMRGRFFWDLGTWVACGSMISDGIHCITVYVPQVLSTWLLVPPILMISGPDLRPGSSHKCRGERVPVTA